MDASGVKNSQNVSRHLPVMQEELAIWLLHGKANCICDGTVGYGGHAETLLSRMGPESILVGIDRDAQALAASKERLARFGKRALLIKGLFGDMKHLLQTVGISEVDGVLLDLGVSSPQLDDPARGFSFQAEGPLDMRMDQSMGQSAADLVNSLPESDLADLIYQYGEERYSRRIARAIVRARDSRSLQTTQDLVAVISESVPSSYRHGRIHCATRTFQALRIAVNREIESLGPALRQAVDVVRPGGRIGVISFHSLEDRIVKHTFRDLAQAPDARLTVLTKKPQIPTEEECRSNPRARSAKLRVAERLPKELVQ